MSFSDFITDIVDVIPYLLQWATNILNSLMNNYIFLLVFYVSLFFVVLNLLYFIINLILYKLNDRKTKKVDKEVT